MTNQKNGRELALSVLLSIDEHGQMLHVALRKELSQASGLSKTERAFASRLAVGTIERGVEIDYILNAFSSTPTKKMKPVIRNILRMAVYQMKYMDTVPDSAACNEAVKMTKAHNLGGLSRFVNGVLRSIARNLSEMVYPDPVREPNRAMAVKYSMPEWLTRRIAIQCGPARCRQILASFLEERRLTVRVDTKQISRKEAIRQLEESGLLAEEDPQMDCALRITGGIDTVDAIPLFKNGVISVQDTASMQVGLAADPKPGDYVIDVCAAPGGKSVHIAQLLEGTGRVEARDQNAYKISLIEENKERCGLSNLEARVFSALEFDAASENAADIVLADLPCSGLGVIGRKPDIKYRISESDIGSLAHLQQQILSVVCKYVRPGGKLIYSTCTITNEENIENVRQFLSGQSEFVLESQRQFLPDEGCDGFFLAVMRRTEEQV